MILVDFLDVTSDQPILFRTKMAPQHNVPWTQAKCTKGPFWRKLEYSEGPFWTKIECTEGPFWVWTISVGQTLCYFRNVTCVSIDGVNNFLCYGALKYSKFAS